MKKSGICDKCGKETECITEEFICASESSEKLIDEKGEKAVTVIQHLTTVTCRLCNECSKKRKYRFFLFAFSSLVASLPFFIWWMYLEFGFVMLVVSAAVLYLSTNKHELEYLARYHYRLFKEGKDDLSTHPDIFTKAEWEKMISMPAKDNSRIIRL